MLGCVSGTMGFGLSGALSVRIGVRATQRPEGNDDPAIRSDRRALAALWLVGDEAVVVGENVARSDVADQLGEDMVDVGLHRTFTDEELLGDLGVCAASTDQSEDVEFALGELVECRSGKCGGGWGVAVDGEDSAGHCGVEPGVTGGNGSYGSMELVSGHTFEDESGSPGAQHPGERFVVVEGGESENWKARQL